MITWYRTDISRNTELSHKWSARACKYNCGEMTNTLFNNAWIAVYLFSGNHSFFRPIQILASSNYKIPPNSTEERVVIRNGATKRIERHTKWKITVTNLHLKQIKFKSNCISHSAARMVIWQKERDIQQQDQNKFHFSKKPFPRCDTVLTCTGSFRMFMLITSCITCVLFSVLP